MAFSYDLTQVVNRDQLLTYLGVDVDAFDKVLAFDTEDYARAVSSANLEAYLASPFHQHKIPKKNPKDLLDRTRIVWEATSTFDRHYKSTARRLEAFFTFRASGFPHDNAYGYVRGRNIRQNATRHLGKTNILKCDIKNFFGSISTQTVASLFEYYSVNNEVADLFSRYLTIGGFLPLGLATSPVLTNVLCIGLDDDMTELAEKSSAIYTRYADDLTFSSNKELPDIASIRQIVSHYGFSLAEAKTRYTKVGQSHYVTGLSVSDPLAPHAPRMLKKRLRQELYYAKKFGLHEHLAHIGIEPDEHQYAINSIDGMVKYVAHHEPDQASHLHTTWAKIMKDNAASPSFKPKNRYQAAVDIFADETEFTWDGETYLGLALCVTQHAQTIANTVNVTLANHLANPLADGDMDMIKKNGLHFSDATEDLRKTFVTSLQRLPFAGYAAVARLTDGETYSETYLRLLNSLIRRRLIACDGLFASFRFEETDKVTKTAIKSVVEDAFQKLVAENNRRPFMYNVTTVSKQHPCVALPDFLLGTLRRFLMMRPPQNQRTPERPEIMYEHLRDKLVILLDLDSGEEFSRRNPVRPWFERK
jgi:RNA-directed DNA polymerase